MATAKSRPNAYRNARRPDHVVAAFGPPDQSRVALGAELRAVNVIVFSAGLYLDTHVPTPDLYRLGARINTGFFYFTHPTTRGYSLSKFYVDGSLGAMPAKAHSK